MTLSGHLHVIPVIFQTICLSIAMVRLFDSYRKIFPQLSKGFTIAIERQTVSDTNIQWMRRNCSLIRMFFIYIEYLEEDNPVIMLVKQKK